MHSDAMINKHDQQISKINGHYPLLNVYSLRTGKSPCYWWNMFISYVTNYQRVSWMLLDGHRCTLSFQQMLTNGGIWSWLRHPKKLKHQLINMIAIGCNRYGPGQNISKVKTCLVFFRSWTPKTSDKWMFIHQNIGPIGLSHTLWHGLHPLKFLARKAPIKPNKTPTARGRRHGGYVQPIG